MLIVFKLNNQQMERIGPKVNDGYIFLHSEWNFEEFYIGQVSISVQTIPIFEIPNASYESVKRTRHQEI